MCLGAEIGMFILGVYWLVTGKAKVGKTQQLVGMHVRMMGFILLLALPLAFVLGILIGILAGMEVLPRSVLDYAFIGDALSIIIVFAVVMVYYYAVKGQATSIDGAK
jgi:hypothetical protein